MPLVPLVPSGLKPRDTAEFALALLEFPPRAVPTLQQFFLERWMLSDAVSFRQGVETHIRAPPLRDLLLNPASGLKDLAAYRGDTEGLAALLQAMVSSDAKWAAAAAAAGGGGGGGRGDATAAKAAAEAALTQRLMRSPNDPYAAAFLASRFVAAALTLREEKCSVCMVMTTMSASLFRAAEAAIGRGGAGGRQRFAADPFGALRAELVAQAEREGRGRSATPLALALMAIGRMVRLAAAEGDDFEAKPAAVLLRGGASGGVVADEHPICAECARASVLRPGRALLPSLPVPADFLALRATEALPLAAEAANAMPVVDPTNVAGSAADARVGSVHAASCPTCKEGLFGILRAPEGEALPDGRMHLFPRLVNSRLADPAQTMLTPFALDADSTQGRAMGPPMLLINHTKDVSVVSVLEAFVDADGRAMARVGGIWPLTAKAWYDVPLVGLQPLIDHSSLDWGATSAAVVQRLVAEEGEFSTWAHLSAAARANLAQVYAHFDRMDPKLTLPWPRHPIGKPLDMRHLVAELGSNAAMRARVEDSAEWLVATVGRNAAIHRDASLPLALVPTAAFDKDQALALMGLKRAASGALALADGPLSVPSLGIASPHDPIDAVPRVPAAAHGAPTVFAYLVFRSDEEAQAAILFAFTSTPRYPLVPSAGALFEEGAVVLAVPAADVVALARQVRGFKVYFDAGLVVNTLRPTPSDGGAVPRHVRGVKGHANMPYFSVHWTSQEVLRHLGALQEDQPRIGYFAWAATERSVAEASLAAIAEARVDFPDTVLARDQLPDLLQAAIPTQDALWGELVPSFGGERALAQLDPSGQRPLTREDPVAPSANGGDPHSRQLYADDRQGFFLGVPSAAQLRSPDSALLAREDLVRASGETDAPSSVRGLKRQRTKQFRGLVLPKASARAGLRMPTVREEGWGAEYAPPPYTGPSIDTKEAALKLALDKEVVPEGKSLVVVQPQGQGLKGAVGPSVFLGEHGSPASFDAAQLYKRFDASRFVPLLERDLGALEGLPSRPLAVGEDPRLANEMEKFLRRTSSERSRWTLPIAVALVASAAAEEPTDARREAWAGLLASRDSDVMAAVEPYRPRGFSGGAAGGGAAGGRAGGAAAGGGGGEVFQMGLAARVDAAERSRLEAQEAQRQADAAHVSGVDVEVLARTDPRVFARVNGLFEATQHFIPSGFSSLDGAMANATQRETYLQVLADLRAAIASGEVRGEWLLGTHSATSRTDGFVLWMKGAFLKAWRQREEAKYSQVPRGAASLAPKRPR